MASIIDPTIEENGNPQRALESVQEAINDRKTETSESRGVSIPDKFKGKSIEDVVTAYQNLESLHGRTANELGQVRRSVDQLLQDKRMNDLQANGATRQQVTARQKPAMTAADLLENPTEAIERHLENRESQRLQQYEQRLAVQEQATAQQAFLAKHNDFNDIIGTPEFVEWAKATPWRTELATTAASGRFDAADKLMTEYKAYQPLLTRTAANKQGLDAARQVGLERTVSGTETGTKPVGKIIRRADSMALRISNPDAYESPAYQNELLRAIAEGRYK